MDEILTVKEVADYLKISRTTVWRWCQAGRLTAFKAGRNWRVRRSDVERLMEQPPDEGKTVSRSYSHTPSNS